MYENSEKTHQLRVSNLSKDFGKIGVLRNISFGFKAGESIVITGPSGSGKSTLLHIIGTLEKPTNGNVEINDTDPFQLTEPEVARYRNTVIGFVFQDHHLLPQYSVLENVLIPTLAFKPDTDATKQAHELIRRVGLVDRISHRPSELSGGERQRVAIARALINRPSILLCDEPTGNLDSGTSQDIANLLFEMHKLESNILIVVTHNLDFASRFQNHLRLADGVITVETGHPNADS